MTAGPRVQIVVNPAAGRGKGLALVDPLREALEKHGFRPSFLVTRSPEEARQWLRECDSPPDYVVCLAGDDTVSTLAYDAIEHKIPMVFLPVGFGNIFAEAFGYEPSVESVVKLLTEGRKIFIDVGLRRVNGSGPENIFVAVQGFGFLEDVQLLAEAGRYPRRRGARIAWYTLTALRALLSVRPMKSLKIAVDGRIVATKALMAVVSNVRAYPGHLMLTPEADPVDGRLDVCAVAARSRWALLRSLCALWATGTCDRRIQHWQGERIEIMVQPAVRRRVFETRRDEAADGEWSDTMTVLPHSMPLLVPADYPR